MVSLSGLTSDHEGYIWTDDGGSFVIAETFFGSQTPSVNHTFFVPPGFYFVSVREVDTGMSRLLGVVVTDGLGAIVSQIRTAVKAKIESLALPITAVHEHWLPDFTEADFPCVILTHDAVGQSNQQIVVGTKDIGTQIRILICDRTSRYEHDRMPDYDVWRQRIWDAFDNKRLVGLAMGLPCEIVPDVYSQYMDPEVYTGMVSYLIVNVPTRQPS